MHGIDLVCLPVFGTSCLLLAWLCFCLYQLRQWHLKMCHQMQSQPTGWNCQSLVIHGCLQRREAQLNIAAWLIHNKRWWNKGMINWSVIFEWWQDKAGFETVVKRHPTPPCALLGTIPDWPLTSGTQPKWVWPCGCPAVKCYLQGKLCIKGVSSWNGREGGSRQVRKHIHKSLGWQVGALFLFHCLWCFLSILLPLNDVGLMNIVCAYFSTQPKLKLGKKYWQGVKMLSIEFCLMRCMNRMSSFCEDGKW